MSNHFNANLHQYNNVHATLSHAMFWEALSQPTEWVIAISCKSYCLRKERCIFYSHPTPRMAGFWKGGFGFSSKKVRKKKNLRISFFKGHWHRFEDLGKRGLDKKWMSQVLNLVACVGSISNQVIARKLEWEQKKMEGGRGGEKRKHLPRNPTILESTPWYFMVLFICKLTACQHRSQYNRLL